MNIERVRTRLLPFIYYWKKERKKGRICTFLYVYKWCNGLLLDFTVKNGHISGGPESLLSLWLWRRWAKFQVCQWWWQYLLLVWDWFINTSDTRFHDVFPRKHNLVCYCEDCVTIHHYLNNRVIYTDYYVDCFWVHSEANVWHSSELHDCQSL